MTYQSLIEKSAEHGCSITIKTSPIGSFTVKIAFVLNQRLQCIEKEIHFDDLTNTSCDALEYVIDRMIAQMEAARGNFSTKPPETNMFIPFDEYYTNNLSNIGITIDNKVEHFEKFIYDISRKDNI